MSERPAPYLIDVRSLAMVGAAAVVAGSIGALFVWMTPRAAAREVRAACDGMRSNPVNSSLGRLPVQAPDLVAPEYDGQPFHLASLKGKVVLVNFWGSWCSVCKSEKPSMASFTDHMAQDGFEVVTIASDVNWDSIKRVLPKGAPYHVLLDQTAEDGEVGAIAHAWGVKAVPESFIIDRTGKIRMYLDNKRDWNGDIARTCIQSIIDE